MTKHKAQPKSTAPEISVPKGPTYQEAKHAMDKPAFKEPAIGAEEGVAPNKHVIVQTSVQDQGVKIRDIPGSVAQALASATAPDLVYDEKHPSYQSLKDHIHARVTELVDTIPDEIHADFSACLTWVKTRL